MKDDVRRVEPSLQVLLWSEVVRERLYDRHPEVIESADRTGTEEPCGDGS